MRKLTVTVPQYEFKVDCNGCIHKGICTSFGKLCHSFSPSELCIRQEMQFVPFRALSDALDAMPEQSDSESMI